MISLVGLAIVAGVGLASVWTLRKALEDVARLAESIDQRAHDERHVLAGRIQRPELFPTAPIRTPIATATAHEDEDTDSVEHVAGFEAAGRGLSGLSPSDLAAVFGQEFVNGAQ